MRIWDSPVEGGVATFGLGASIGAGILPGLPYAGAEYHDVSEHGRRLVSAGFVVRFSSSDGGSWIGNFAPGPGGISGVFRTFDPITLLVVAEGRGYWVTTATQFIVAPPDPIRDIIVSHELRSVFLAGWTDIARYDAHHALVWKERVVADELFVDRFEDGFLCGHGNAGTESITFECDALTGAIRYPEGVRTWWREPS